MLEEGRALEKREEEEGKELFSFRSRGYTPTEKSTYLQGFIFPIFFECLYNYKSTERFALRS